MVTGSNQFLNSGQRKLEYNQQVSYDAIDVVYMTTNSSYYFQQQFLNTFNVIICFPVKNTFWEPFKDKNVQIP